MTVRGTVTARARRPSGARGLFRALKWIALALLLLIVGAIAWFWTPDTDSRPMRAKYANAASRFEPLGGGLTVHLRDEGPRGAPVIMLLHGSNAALQTWDDWTGRLTRAGYRVVRFDQIGHGLTGASPRRDYRMAAFVDTVERVRQKLGIERFVLAGNSMGGGVAWNYALAHPERLRGLALVASSGWPEPSRKPPPLVFRLAQSDLLEPLLLKVTPRALIASGLRAAVADPSIMSEAEIDMYWELLRYPGNRQATLDRGDTPRERASAADLSKLRVPTLVMAGAKDRLLPVEGSHWFARVIPNATKVIYPEIGHIPMEELPDRSSADLGRWLVTLPR